VRTAAALGVAAALALTGACGGPRRPAPPKPDHDPLALLGGSGPAERPTLAALLARYPLGDAQQRTDLLAADAERSIFLVQTRRGVPAHFHRSHRERAWVLAGSGTCYVDGRTYPAVPGSAFVVQPGLVHRVVDDGSGAPLVALAVFEPPVTSIDEDRVKVE
jgi:mannose-6-phosphate isomerase-like protein (cupin superfamily)